MNEKTASIEITPEVKLTISAKLLWAGIVGIIAIVGTVMLTYNDIKSSISSLMQKNDAEVRMINYRLDRLENKK